MVERWTDTSAEADRVWTEVFRALSPGRKWALLGEAFRTGRALHAAGYRLRHPDANAADVHREWLLLQYGYAGEIKGEPRMDPAAQNLQVLRQVLAAFTQLGIPYALGGSMASSVYGIPRQTQDADITVEPFPGKEARLATSFGPDYYVSLPAIEQAVRDRSSFHLINTREGFKVDVFVRPDQPFEQKAMERRTHVPLPDLPGEPVSLYTAEDVILFKLRWYRLGNETSTQQWDDILGVLKVQAGRLDDAYLDQWAATLNVADLLGRARQEVG
jgi:hypothetical protein